MKVVQGRTTGKPVLASCPCGGRASALCGPAPQSIALGINCVCDRNVSGHKSVLLLLQARREQIPATKLKKWREVAFLLIKRGRCERVYLENRLKLWGRQKLFHLFL